MSVKVKRLLPVVLVALVAVPPAQASTLTSTVTKLPGKTRVNSTFQFIAPECVPIDPGPPPIYPIECETGDLVFRVARKVLHKPRWKGVHAESTFVYTDNYLLPGNDVTRLYNSDFRGFRFFGGQKRCLLHRLRVTLVDNFVSTPDPTVVRIWRPCYRL